MENDPSGKTTTAGADNWRVLLVEDTEMLRRLLTFVLANRNLHVEAAEHGGDALEMIESNPPDIILCDMSMPVMDGRELLARVKSNPKMTGIPVIVLTAEETADSEAELMALGAAAVLEKTLPHDQIIQAIITTLGGPQRKA